MFISLLLLCLLWSLEEVHSQTRYPVVSFLGETLPNHAYVNLSLVGDNYNFDGVRCHTDLDTCCRSSQGDHLGDWFFPNEEILPHFTASTDIVEARGPQRVDIWRRNNNVDQPSGIYRCDIPTNAVHDDIDISVRDSVYVGLYASGGNLETKMFTYTHECVSVMWFIITVLYIDMYM